MSVPTRRILRVAVDATALIGPRTGVGEVTFGLLGALAARSDVEPVAYAVSYSGRDALPGLLPRGVVAATLPCPARVAHALWRIVPSPRIEAWTGRVDVVHATNFVAPPARAPVVVTVHDLTFVRFPELCTRAVLRYEGGLRRALARGATVHTPSDFVASEVREAFALPHERVFRVHNGLTPIGGGDPAAGRRLAGVERYVLALGTVEPRKNLPTLVRAFDACAADAPDLRLVVAGPDGWDGDAFAAACSAARHRDRVVRLGYVREAERADLLAGAAVFAYPSVYEGFGLPPLEAMQAGVPVVASDAGALPEVLGDAARLVDPHDADALAAALAALLHDDAQRADLVARGRERSARYSWTRAADELVIHYRALTGLD